MRIKAGVRIDKLQPQMTLALMAVDRVWWLHGREPTMTSGDDGKHRMDSLHYRGMAGDFRTRDLSITRALFFRDQVKEMLGDNFDVILERNPPHLHIEYDPDEIPETLHG